MVSTANIAAYLMAAVVTKCMLSILLSVHYELSFDNPELVYTLTMNCFDLFMLLMSSFLIQYRKYGWTALVLFPPIAFTFTEMACIIVKTRTTNCDVQCKIPADEEKPSSPTTFAVRQDPCYENRFLIVLLCYEVSALLFILCLEMMLMCCPLVFRPPDVGRYLDKNLEGCKKSHEGSALSVYSNAKNGLPSTWPVNNTTSFTNYNFQLSDENQRSRNQPETQSYFTPAGSTPDSSSHRVSVSIEGSTQSSIESGAQSGMNSTQSKSRSEVPGSQASISPTKVRPVTI